MGHERLMSRRTFVAGAAIGAAGMALGLSGCSTSDAASQSSSQTGNPLQSSSDGSSIITAAVAYKGTDFYPPHNRSALAIAANWHVLQGLYDYDPRTHEARASLALGDPEPVTSKGTSASSSDSSSSSTSRTGTSTSETSSSTSASGQEDASATASEAAATSVEGAAMASETTASSDTATTVSDTAQDGASTSASGQEGSSDALADASSENSEGSATAGSSTTAEDTEALEYRVKIRSQVSFSDGTALTVNDVVNAFELNMKDGDYAQFLSFIEKVEAVDDTTISFTLNYPCDNLKERLSLVKVFPASANQQDMKGKPVGTGPWMYRSVQGIDGGNIEFIPNSHYDGDQKAACDLMHWDVLIDGTSRVQKFVDGNVDVVDTVPEGSVDSLKEAGGTIWHEQGFVCPIVVFNTKRAPFDDVRARQAFLYAIDRDRLIAETMGGYATAATSVLPENHEAYHRASTVYTLDTERAQSLLAEAGAEGAQITLRYNANWISDLVNTIIENEQDVGFNISSERSASPLDDVTDEANDVQPFDVIITSSDPTMLGNDADFILTWFYGDTTWTQTRSSWADSEAWTQLQELLDQARRERDADLRQEIWDQCQDLVSEEVPIYPLFHRMLGTASDAEVLRGFRAGGTTGPYLLGASLT